MKRRLLAVLALVLIACCRRATGGADLRLLPTESNELSKAAHVLFVGNSLTYYNMMPALFEQIAKSRGIEVQARAVVRGGATLKWHWNNGDVQHALAAQTIDVVVIQPMSSEIIVNPDDTRHYAWLMANAARASGAQVVLYAPWPPKVMLRQQDEFARRYRALAASVHGRLAPVFAAWQDVRSQGTELYDSSDLHPNLAGSYLAASVLFATIFDRDPAGATRNFDIRVPDQNGDFTALTHEHIDDAQAAALQRAAWNAVKHEPLAKTVK